MVVGNLPWTHGAQVQWDGRRSLLATVRAWARTPAGHGELMRVGL